MKLFIRLLAAFTLCSCTSVAKYNARLQKPLPPEELQKDVDFARRKLQQLHPNLYWYTSQEQLNGQFDSLKLSLKDSLTPAEFYNKLAPVIAGVREGHLRLVPPEKRLTRKELKKLENQKGLFSRMNYVLDGRRIFVKDNADKFENIKVGTEILAIKGIPVDEYLQRYEKIVNSDGYNTTFQKYSMARRWPVFFTLENGILDSVQVTVRYNRDTADLYLHREIRSRQEKKEEKKATAIKKKDPEQKDRDYNPVIKAYNRDLQFLGKDSSIAFMKIKTFSGTYSRKFYRKSFEKISRNKSDYLILDIRDNLGGSLSEIHNLYSYLSRRDFRFINNIEVTSRTSMFAADYLSDLPGMLKPAGVMIYPFYMLGTALSSYKKDGKVYLRNNNVFTVKKPKKNAFAGEIYVLINGSSFSASSILAARLKSEGRAVLVGEETGGANDGTVAGRYSTVKLPNSGLYLPIGLMLIQPDIAFSGTGHGVMPDISVPLSLQDVLSKKDLQLNRVIDIIRAQQKENKLPE